MVGVLIREFILGLVVLLGSGLVHVLLLAPYSPLGTRQKIKPIVDHHRIVYFVAVLAGGLVALTLFIDLSHILDRTSFGNLVGSKYLLSLACAGVMTWHAGVDVWSVSEWKKRRSEAEG